MKCGGLGFPEPRLLMERAYNTFKSDSEVLVGSLLGGTDLNYVAYKGCVHKAITDGRKQHNISETEELTRQKELADGAGLNCIRQVM